MLHILLTYWPVFLLLALQHLVEVVASVAALRMRARLDDAIPDTLPQTAGEWLAERLAALRIGVTAIVTDRHANAYHPRDRLIHLDARTHFKADPVYWASAAHELGHARLRVEAPFVGHLRSAADMLRGPLLGAGVGLAFGYVLYGIPLAGTLAFACLAAAAATGIGVLLDEALASVLAMRELRANDAIDFVHLRAARTMLILWFLTYVARYVTCAVMLGWWPVVVEPASAHELAVAGWVACAVLSLASIVGIVLRLVELLAPGALARYPRFESYASYGAALAIAALIWIVWDYRLDPLYAWCVIAAIAASYRVWIALLCVPRVALQVVLAMIVPRFSGPRIAYTPEPLAKQRARTAAVRAGNARLAAIARHWRHHPPLAYRLAHLAKLGYLPLLVTFWLSILA